MTEVPEATAEPRLPEAEAEAMVEVSIRLSGFGFG
jgi:hypothetical protein